MCHLVLFMPLLALPVFWLLPWPLAAAIYVCVLAISAWLYYVTIRLMHRPSKIGPHTLLDSDGTIVQAKGLCGLARIGRELWKVQSRTPLVEKQQVRVTCREGFVLRVTDAVSGIQEDSTAETDASCNPARELDALPHGSGFLRRRDRPPLC